MFATAVYPLEQGVLLSAARQLNYWPFALPRVQEKPLAWNQPRTRYFQESKLFHLKYNCCAEVIRKPAKSKALVGRESIQSELWDVVLQACGQDENQNDYYRSMIHIEKIAWMVDYLILVHKAGKILGFATGTYIDYNVVYLNTAVMLPDYQQIGLGSIMAALLLKVIVDEAQGKRKSTPQFVCRTSNQNAASSLLAALINGQISSEVDYDPGLRRVFKKTAAYLHCGLDEYGISRDVYPKGMPKGGQVSNPRVREAFRGMNASDACYITGQLNKKFIDCLLKRSMTEPR